MKLVDIFFCWDFILSGGLTVIFTCALPCRIDNNFAHDLYGIGISVLSIIFSVYFAALAIIMVSGDDEFALFVDETGDYTGIIETFQFSLGVLFIALLYSVGVYGLSAANISNDMHTQDKWWFILYAFLFMYGMFAAANATYDSIKYSTYRIKYLKSKPKTAPGSTKK